VAGALQTDELGDVFQVLAKDKLFAPGHDRHIAHAELDQTFTALRIVQDIDGDKINFFARKKLFRPETTASPRLGKEYELFSGSAHA